MIKCTEGPLPEPLPGARALVENNGKFEVLEEYGDGVWSAQFGMEVRTVRCSYASRFVMLPRKELDR